MTAIQGKRHTKRFAVLRQELCELPAASTCVQCGKEIPRGNHCSFAREEGKAFFRPVCNECAEILLSIGIPLENDITRLKIGI